jgi:outer membrane receptor for ferric coprogen and ferric-rhodotorulic acid
MLHKQKNSAFKLSLLTSLVLSGHAVANDTQDNLPLEKIAFMGNIIKTILPKKRSLQLS